MLHAYYSGFDFLRGREDDYYSTVYVRGRSKARFWIISEDFDEAFEEWRLRLLAGLREAEAGEAE